MVRRGFESGTTISIVNTRTSAGGRTVEGDTKTAAGRRVLPLPDHAVTVLRAARKRQTAERLKLGLGSSGEHFGYVISNEVGQPYGPAVLSKMWRSRGQGCRVTAYQVAWRWTAHGGHQDAA